MKASGPPSRLLFKAVALVAAFQCVIFIFPTSASQVSKQDVLKTLREHEETISFFDEFGSSEHLEKLIEEMTFAELNGLPQSGLEYLLSHHLPQKFKFDSEELKEELKTQNRMTRGKWLSTVLEAELNEFGMHAAYPRRNFVQDTSRVRILIRQISSYPSLHRTYAIQSKILRTFFRNIVAISSDDFSRQIDLMEAIDAYYEFIQLLSRCNLPDTLLREYRDDLALVFHRADEISQFLLRGKISWSSALEKLSSLRTFLISLRVDESTSKLLGSLPPYDSAVAKERALQLMKSLESGVFSSAPEYTINTILGVDEPWEVVIHPTFRSNIPLEIAVSLFPAKRIEIFAPGNLYEVLTAKLVKSAQSIDILQALKKSLPRGLWIHEGIHTSPMKYQFYSWNSTLPIFESFGFLKIYRRPALYWNDRFQLIAEPSTLSGKKVWRVMARLFCAGSLFQIAVNPFLRKR